MVERLDTEQATAYFDDEHRIVRIAYRGTLGAEPAEHVYEWLDHLMKDASDESIQGEIFDFQQVVEFLPENLRTARKSSKRLNLRLEKVLPVALIVKTFYQEEMLRSAMQIPPDHPRKRIVHTEAEAVAFIIEWHRIHHAPEETSLT